MGMSDDNEIQSHLTNRMDDAFCAAEGGPVVKKPTRQGFGTRVMERMIRDQHKGDLRLDWRAEGLACEIILPV
jgi:two-component sensor histidine kinase